MEYDTAEEKIRDEHSHHPSVDDQVRLKEWFNDQALFASEDEWTRANAVDDATVEELDHKVQGILDNLERLNLLKKKDLHGGRSFIRSERTDELFFTPEEEDFLRVLAEEVSRVIADIQSEDDSNDAEETLAAFADGGDEGDESVTKREVAAEVLKVEPEGVERELTTPADPVERMQSYDEVVEAIKESDEVDRNRDYDRMGWRNRANRWAISISAEKYEDISRAGA